MSVSGADRRYDAVKRVLDASAAGVGLIVLSPVIAGVAVVVRAKLGGPVLFRQQRPGKHGVPFTLLKFRSMLDVDEDSGRVTDEDRLTAFGRKLRSASLDELPTLWNVLRGDMSIVGPRPLLMSYLTLYSPAQARRHDVRPGVTGLAQARGRNSISWEERLRLDGEYVDSRSFALDLRILVETARAVLTRTGISHDGHATMPAFDGTTGSEAS